MNDSNRNADLSAEEVRRYGRHLVLEEFGPEAQRRLKRARVLVVGVGGLGSPLATYLAAAGVGTLGLVDDDVVDLTNLQRQTLHGTSDVGRPKLDSAVETLRHLNPHVRLVPHAVRLDASNARDLVSAYDLVADGSDNFSTRYLVNDACVLEGKPEVYGAVLRFEGQVSVFGGGAPCYRCLFPEPPEPGSVPNCAEAGVLGVLPGVIGTLQANETIKLLTGIGRPLRGRLLRFDALEGSFREVRLARREDCPVCGDAPRITEVEAIADSCETPSRPGLEDATEETDVGADPYTISVEELARRRAEGDAPIVLDVRLPQELQIAQLGEGVVHLPLHVLPVKLGELDPQREYAVLCHHGGRSWQAVQFLRSRGFARPRNVEGGIDRWSTVVDASVPRY